jgi:hypothetical protein
MLDAGLSWLVERANQICVCNEKPDTYGQATSTYEIVKASINAGNFIGPLDIIVDVGLIGRLIIIDEVLTGEADNYGTSAYVALVSASKLLYVVPCQAAVIDVDHPQARIGAWCISNLRPNVPSAYLEECTMPEGY